MQKQLPAPASESHEIVLVGNEEIPIQTRAIQVHKPRGIVVRNPTKLVSVGNKRYTVDAQQLMRVIKFLTQTIGEHKNQEGLCSEYTVSGLRHSRSLAVQDLENKFGIHWQINSAGESEFWRL